MPALSRSVAPRLGKEVGAGRAEWREVGGRDVQLVIWREESLRSEARFEAAEAVAKDAAR